MKKNITSIRQNVSNEIWKYTRDVSTLHKDNWTTEVKQKLKKFESTLVWAMRKGGWNGDDNENSLQWTEQGALFYSIIVITTIG